MPKSYMEIYTLNNDAVHYMLDVEEALASLIQAISDADDDRLNEIIDNDINFNNYRDILEDKCLKLFLREQHYSRDLRNLLSVFKITTEVERLGDQIRDIAENFIGQRLSACPDEQKAFMEMLNNAREMFAQCIKCFASFDDAQTFIIRRYDDVIDTAYHNIKAMIREEMEHGVTEVLFNLLSAVKHTEKIGDHIANIAEWIHYVVSSERK